MQGLMDGLVRKGLKAALALQAGKEYQDLLGTLDSKVSLVQGDILDIVETWYAINLIIVFIMLDTAVCLKYTENSCHLSHIVSQ